MRTDAPLEARARRTATSPAGGKSRRASAQRRIFVLDTNVLMHDPAAIFRFAEHDIYIPMIVLEELDAGKKGTSEPARNVRQVSRFLDELMAGATKTQINQGLTNLSIRAIVMAGEALFAGTQGGGVFLSTDDGDNWTPINIGLICKTVRSLVVKGRNLFAGTDGGVWRYSF